jgi:hypothetical protein
MKSGFAALDAMVDTVLAYRPKKTRKVKKTSCRKKQKSTQR